ncbi:phosphonate ABC transporter, permease protein PhnE [Clostridium sp. 19966]|uniref:phosphonate ABC transporter, permease protein PhnE n=1 Tax=Clostridium sp. 19966 TaxID=2768166 RepID=UPI0028DFF6D8|nr:phosphonate ABC transporter, permease protein PhnE [Clostridium sp. 19966]MDT8717199.1 phosphonate ABC transporter, permease protein PhnE [Clostridium sp. 19966]
MINKKKIKNIIILIVILLIYIWAFSGLKIGGIKSSAGQVVSSIIHGLFHPDWAYINPPDGEGLISTMIETIAIAILGTFVSAVLCIPIAFIAANNIVSFKAVPFITKFLLSFIRTFPELVMAILFIKAVGPGAFAGVLALGVHSVGMLGKLYAEAIENMDMGPSEALVACGANKFQVLWFAVIPQILPEFASLTLYRFDINVRSASILGLIGAGGIGTPLIFALNARGWSRVGIILLGIIITVIIIEFLSSAIRKRLV